MKPLSPSPWFVGGSRTTDERTPLEARSRVICALRARIAGPPVKSVVASSRSGMSRSVARRPGGDEERAIRTHERFAEGLYGEAVRVGSAFKVAREGKVVLEREVDHPV